MGMSFFSFSLRMLRRDAHAGELRLLAAALVVAVAALTAVGFFTDRVRQALEREANQLLGADLLMVADHPWQSSHRALVAEHGLNLAETSTFPSMVSMGDGDATKVQLAEIKAVSSTYPLRGSLRVSAALHAPDDPASGIPARGFAWVDERLAAALAVRVGDVLRVGAQVLQVSAILTLEPDRGVNFFSVAPRLLMNLGDLEATGLIQPGSRIIYRLLVAGEPQSIKTFRGRVSKIMGRGERIEDAENARPEIRTALDRAQKFLGIAALLSVILAAVAVALAARRYMQRHLDPCAVMRCLGATQDFLLRAYLGQFVVLGLVAAGVGCALGFLSHFVLHAWLAHLLAAPLPAPGILPVVHGMLSGMVLLFGFALPPLMQIKRVSTLRVLRREFSDGGMPQLRLIGGYAVGFFALAGLMFWMAGDWRLGSYLVGGFSGATLLFSLLARAFVYLASRLRGHSAETMGGRVGWRFGLASLERHALASVMQIVALALGFMALLLLTVVRNDLMGAWQRAVPPDAPNRFVVNIQPEQLEEVRRFFSEDGLASEFSPMIRGRLARVNGIENGPEKYDDERARRLVEREFNLSYRSDLPSGNSIVAGRWFSAGEMEAAGEASASVEEGLAKTLHLKVGDRLGFVVAGEPVEVRIVGLRKLNWDSMRVNFFVLTPPKVLDVFPASWITSFYLAPDKGDFVNHLVRQFPNLTVVDVAAIVRQLQSIMDQVAQAIQFVFLFTLLAGVIVLYAALASAAEERRYELAIMRALGALRQQLRSALVAELAAIGGLAGLIASSGAIVIGQLLARHAFQLEVAVAYWLLPVAMLGGAVLVTAAGWLAASRLISISPLSALRAGG